MTRQREVTIEVAEGILGAMLAVPETPRGLVIIAHGSGSSRFSARNRFVADVEAVVSRGGRPDLARASLDLVKAATLLIVGGEDHAVIRLNRQAQAAMRCKNELAIVPGATHLFEEPGALERVAQLAGAWFRDHLKAG